MFVIYPVKSIFENKIVTWRIFCSPVLHLPYIVTCLLGMYCFYILNVCLQSSCKAYCLSGKFVSACNLSALVICLLEMREVNPKTSPLPISSSFFTELLRPPSCFFVYMAAAARARILKLLKSLGVDSAGLHRLY